MHLIYYQTKAATIGIVTGGCHVCLCFIVVFGAIESSTSDWCVRVCVSAYACTGATV